MVPKKPTTDEQHSFAGTSPRGGDRPIMTTGEMRASAGRVTDLTEELRNQIHRGNLTEPERLRLEAFLEELQQVPIPKDYTPENASSLIGLIRQVEQELDVHKTRSRQVIDWLEISLRPGIVDFPEFPLYREKIEHFFEELRRQNIVLRDIERSRIRHTIELIQSASTATSLKNIMSEFVEILEASYEYHKKYPDIEFDKSTGRLVLTAPNGQELLKEESEFFKNYKFQSTPYDPHHISCLLEGRADSLEININWSESKPEDPPFLTARIDKKDILFSGPILFSKTPSINSLTETVQLYKQKIQNSYDATDLPDIDPNENWEFDTDLSPKEANPNITGAQSTIDIQGSPEERRTIQILSAFEDFRKIRDTLSPEAKKDKPSKYDKWQTDANINKIYELYEHDEQKLLAELAQIPLSEGHYIVTLQVENPLFYLQLTEKELNTLPTDKASLYRDLHDTKQLTYFQISPDKSTDIPLSVPKKLLANRPSLHAYIKYHRFEREKGMSAPILGELVVDSENTVPGMEPEQYWGLSKSSYAVERRHSITFFEQGWAEFDNHKNLEWLERNTSFRRLETPYVSIATISLSHGQEKRFILFQKTFSPPPEDGDLMKTIRQRNGRMEHFVIKNTIQDKKQAPQYQHISVDIQKTFIPIEEKTLFDGSNEIVQKEGTPELPSYELFLLEQGWSEIQLSTLQQWLQAGNCFSSTNKFNYLEVIPIQIEGETPRYFIQLTKTKNERAKMKKQLKQYYFVDSDILQYDLFKTFQNELESYATVPEYQSPQFGLEETIYHHLQGEGFAICPEVIYNKWMDEDPQTGKYGIEECFTLWSPTFVSVITVFHPETPDQKIRYVRVEKTPFTNKTIQKQVHEANYSIEHFSISKDHGFQKMQEQETKKAAPESPLPPKIVQEVDSSYEKLTPGEKQKQTKSFLQKTVKWAKAGLVAAAVGITALLFPGIKKKMSDQMAEATSADAGATDAHTYALSLDAGINDSSTPDAQTYTTELVEPKLPEKSVDRTPAPPKVEQKLTPEVEAEHWVTIGVEGNAVSTAVINDLLEKYKKNNPSATEITDYKKKITQIVGNFVIKNNIPWNVFSGDTIQYEYSEKQDGSIIIESIQYHKKGEKITAQQKKPELTFAPVQVSAEEKFSIAGHTFTPGEVIEYLPSNSQPQPYIVVGTSEDAQKLILQSIEKPKSLPIILDKTRIDTRIPEKGNKTFTIDGLWIEELFDNAFNIRFSEASGKGVIKALATLILAIDYNGEKAKWGFALLDANKVVAKANTTKHIQDTYDMAEYSEISNLVRSTDSFVAKKQDGIWKIESAYFSLGKKRKITTNP